jgi:hypothetical protein
MLFAPGRSHTRVWYLASQRDFLFVDELGPVTGFAHWELQGEKLAGSRLSEAELDELNELVKRRRALVKGVQSAEVLTDKEIARYEALVGTAAGDPQLFERKRRDKTAKAKLGELKEERRVASLPKRPVYAEPGSIELPRYVFSWLLADSIAPARRGASRRSDCSRRSCSRSRIGNR